MKRQRQSTRSLISYRDPDDAQVPIDHCHLPMGMRHIPPVSLDAKLTVQCGNMDLRG